MTTLTEHCTAPYSGHRTESGASKCPVHSALPPGSKAMRRMDEWSPATFEDLAPGDEVFVVVRDPQSFECGARREIVSKVTAKRIIINKTAYRRHSGLETVSRPFANQLLLLSDPRGHQAERERLRTRALLAAELNLKRVRQNYDFSKGLSETAIGNARMLAVTVRTFLRRDAALREAVLPESRHARVPSDADIQAALPMVVEIIQPLMVRLLDTADDDGLYYLIEMTSAPTTLAEFKALAAAVHAVVGVGVGPEGPQVQRNLAALTNRLYCRRIKSA